MLLGKKGVDETGKFLHRPEHSKIALFCTTHLKTRMFYENENLIEPDLYHIRRSVDWIVELPETAEVEL